MAFARALWALGVIDSLSNPQTPATALPKSESVIAEIGLLLVADFPLVVILLADFRQRSPLSFSSNGGGTCGLS